MKIGKHKYKIQDGDEFLDNGICVQLITQSKEKSNWGKSPHPVLSKLAIKELHELEYEVSKYRDTECVVYTIKGSK